jgi:hypothetical protein
MLRKLSRGRTAMKPPSAVFRAARVRSHQHRYRGKLAAAALCAAAVSDPLRSREYGPAARSSSHSPARIGRSRSQCTIMRFLNISSASAITEATLSLTSLTTPTAASAFPSTRRMNSMGKATPSDLAHRFNSDSGAPATHPLRRLWIEISILRPDIVVRALYSL